MKVTFEAEIRLFCTCGDVISWTGEGRDLICNPCQRCMDRNREKSFLEGLDHIAKQGWVSFRDGPMPEEGEEVEIRLLANLILRTEEQETQDAVFREGYFEHRLFPKDRNSKIVKSTPLFMGGAVVEWRRKP